MTGQSWIRRTSRPFDQYVGLANSFVRNPDLPLAARAVGAWLLSHAESYRFSVQGIATANRCGVDQVKAALRALEDGGYLTRQPVKDDAGRFVGIEYLMTDEPAVSADRRRSAPLAGFPPAAEPPAVSSTGGEIPPLKKTRSALEDHTPEDQRSTPSSTATAAPSLDDDLRQPSLSDTPPVQAAVQDLGTAPERETDLFTVETSSADDLARPAVRHEAAWLELWDLWPRHVGKAPALKAWVKAVKLADPQEILEGARRYATATRGTDPRFVKHLGPWLNDQRWTDEPELTSNGRGGGHVPFQCPDESAYYGPLRARA